MSNPSKRQVGATLRGIRFAWPALFSAMLLSCAEPPEKPIPALKPAPAAPENGTPVQTLAAPMQPGSVTRMPLGDLYQLVQSNAALIYDVRPAIYFRMGHIPGAVSWPKSKLAADLPANEARIRSANSANTPVVIYCTDFACPDAVSVANALAARGHRVSVLQGGYEAWKIANG
ncbi:rhodanese-like domain-containing protein [Akkermansiaceae bacterium]|nr:rhodanese-like domain-containing protein [Akkermansiaceae bacterium]